MDRFRLSRINVFTGPRSRGNPAGVCFAPSEPPDTFGPSLAAELELPQLAVVVERNDTFGLRWFTPVAESAFCGHATAAAARALAEWGYVTGSATFDTPRGRLSARVADERVELCLPHLPLDPLASAPEPVARMFGPDVAWYRSELDYVARLPDEAAVRAFVPDSAAVRALPARGLAITAEGSGDFDFVSRFFAPRLGHDEDHATGSLHGALAGFWSARLGSRRLRAFQASPRGGELRLEWSPDRVLVSGETTVVFDGVLRYGVQRRERS